MPHRSLLALSTLLVSCGLTAVATAGTETAEVVADRDNTLYDDTLVQRSNGAGQFMFAGVNGLRGGFVKTRGLVRFDVAGSLPKDASIASASLFLTVDTPQERFGAVDLHRVTSDWGEAGSVAPMGGGGGAPAQTGDATWTHTFFDTGFWQTPGGDFDATASAMLEVPSNGTQSWTAGEAMLADIEAWHTDPSQNYGWIILASDEDADALRFVTRNGNAQQRPMLEILYHVPEPVGWQAAAAALAALAGLGRSDARARGAAQRIPG